MKHGIKKATVSKKRKHRRLIWIVSLSVFLTMLVFILPYLISTGPGTSLAFSILSGQVKGDIEAEDLSISWLGPTKINSLSVKDVGGRNVLEVENISWAGGVWRAVTEVENFEQVNLDDSSAVLHISDDGGISLVQALEPSKPKPYDHDEPMPQPKGKLILRDMNVQLVREDGRSYDVRDINGGFELNTLNEITGGLKAKLGQQGVLSGELEIRELLQDGKLTPDRANGEVRVFSDYNIDLASLTEFALEDAVVAGKLSLEIDATLKQGRQLTGNLDATITDLHTPRDGAVEIKPIDVSVVGRLLPDESNVKGELSVASRAGEFQALLIYPRDKGFPKFKADKIASAAMAGEHLELSEFNLEASGKIDLPTLGDSIPAVMKLKRDVDIQQGRLDISEFLVIGGETPTAKARVELKDLQATKAGRIIRSEPIVLRISADSQEQRGVLLFGDIKTGFGNAEVNASADNMTTDFSLNLEQLDRQFGEIFELTDGRLWGDLTGRLDVIRPQKDRLDFAVKANISSFRYETPKRDLDFAKADFSHKGNLVLKDKKPVRYIASENELGIDESVFVSGDGWYDFKQKTFEGDAKLTSEIAYLGRRADYFGMEGLKKYSGILAADAKVGKASLKEIITVSANGRIEDLRVNGQNVTQRNILFNMAESTFARKHKTLKIPQASVDSDVARVDFRGINCKLTEPLSLNGTFDINSDLSKAMPAIKKTLELKKQPAIEGELQWTGRFDSKGSAVTSTGRGEIANFVIGEEKQFSEPKAQFSYEAELDQQEKSLVLRRAEVNSRLVSGKMSGNLKRYDTDRIVELTGNYTVNMDRLSTLLGEFSPSMADNISFTGSRNSSFSATGPTSQQDVRPGFKGLDAQSNFGWDSGRLYGLNLGRATLEAKLDDGRVNIPVSAVAASGGKLRMGGLVDFQPTEPRYQLPGVVQVMEDVEINRELADELLSRINPIFARQAEIEGKVSLKTWDISLPLGESIKQGGGGRGYMDLRNLKIQPTGLFRQLLLLSTLSSQEKQTVEVDGVDFVIRNGRIQYDNFVMRLSDDFDMKFYGSVGFDDTVNLVVSLPISPELLDKLGVGGPVIDYARVLNGTRIDIPIVGSRLNPVLDFVRVNVDGLIRRAIQILILEQAGEVGDIFKIPGGESPSQLPPGEDKPQKRPSKDKDIGDTIFDILRGTLEDEDKKEKPE